MDWDVFTSHASEDKDSFVIPFAKVLTTLGVKVWFDKFELKVGDSLTRSIDTGLINSKYGIIILSKAFFSRDWTEYELRSLISREVGYRKVILPIWHGISKDDVMKFSPFLADKFALNTSNESIEEIAIKIIEVVRPDIFENYNRLMAYENLKQNSVKATASIFSINRSRPFRHDSLSLAILLQIKVIQSLFYDVFPVSFEDTVNNFKRDADPEREVMVWHRIAATYLEFIKNNRFELKKKKEIFTVILKISLSSLYEKDFEALKYIDKNEIRRLKALYNAVVPGVESFNTKIYANIDHKDK